MHLSTFQLGSSFNRNVRFVGYLFILVTLICILDGYYWGSMFITVGLFFSATKYGAQIDFEKKLVREYTRVFFIKFGKWVSFDTFDYMTVIGTKTTNAVYSSSSHSIVDSNLFYNVTFVNKKLSRKLEVNRFENMSTAENFCFEITDRCALPFKNYKEILEERKKSFRR